MDKVKVVDTIKADGTKTYKFIDKKYITVNTIVVETKKKIKYHFKKK